MFAYNEAMLPHLSCSQLRRDLSQRNMERALKRKHESTYGSIPSVVYEEDERLHGNFLDASYRAIGANADWRRRLEKSYTGARWIPRQWDRTGRRELDCANSSDALLMNIFCYPRMMHRPDLCGFIGVEPGVAPEFGFKPRTPLLRGVDRTEIDMRLGDVFFEAKLTEAGFRPAASRLLFRYRDFDEVFDRTELRIAEDMVHEYQLLRGILAAYFLMGSFVLLCDGRRVDLQESWFRALRAVRSYSFRSQLKLLTWQELAAFVPSRVRIFLEEKYGIVAA